MRTCAKLVAVPATAQQQRLNNSGSTTTAQQQQRPWLNTGDGSTITAASAFTASRG